MIVRAFIFCCVSLLATMWAAPVGAQAKTDWEKIRFPSRPLFDGINDEDCRKSDQTRVACIAQLSILAQAASRGQEFLICRSQMGEAYEVIRRGDVPALPTDDLLLVRYSPRGIEELRALSIDQPRNLRERLNHEDALLAAIGQVKLTPDVNFTSLREALLARSPLHPRQIAANHLVRLFSIKDPYLRLFQPLTDVGESYVNLNLWPLGDRIVLSHVDPLTNLDRAGLGVGDTILEVNGHKLTYKSVEDAFGTLLPGQDMRLKVATVDGKVVDVSVPQKESNAGVVSSYVIKVNAQKVGVLRVDTFADTRVCELSRAHLRAMDAQGIDRLVYDLRGNPGGYVDQARCSLGLFLGPDQLVFRQRLLQDTPTYMYQLRGRVPESEDVVTDQSRAAPQVPMVTLINASSVSATELVAAALQERGASWMVGDRSYGKGVSQAVLPLLDGEEVLSWKTVTRFDQINGFSVQGHGVSPEFEVPSALGGPLDEYEQPRFVDQHGEAFTTSAVPFRRSPARRRQHGQIRKCLRQIRLSVGPDAARWLRDRQLAGAVAVGLCDPSTTVTAGLR